MLAKVLDVLAAPALRRLTPAVAAALCAAAGAAPVAAAPRWLPASTLVGPLPTEVVGMNHQVAMYPGPQAAFDGDGDLFVAFRKWDGSHYRVGVVQRLRGGAIHTQTLGSSTANVDRTSVRLAVSHNGDALVAWTEANGGVFAAVGHAGRDLTGPGLLGTTATGGGSFADLTVAAGDSGDFAVAFQPLAPGLIQVARRAPGGGIGGPVTVTGSMAAAAQLAITPAGETIVGWTTQATAATNRVTTGVDVSVAPRGGGFSPPAVIPGTVGPAPPSDDETQGGALIGLTTDASGAAHALISSSLRGSFGFASGDLRIADRPAGAGFGAAVAIPGTAAVSSFGFIGGQLTSDRAGDLLVDARQSTAGMAREFVRPAGGAFKVGTVQIGGDTFDGGVTTASGGPDLAGSLYRLVDGSREVVRMIAPDGTVGAAQTLATGEHIMVSFGALAFDDDGDGVALWPDFDGTSERVRMAPYAGAGPRVTAASIPATATVGRAVSLSAAASSNWSSVASIDWSFGDGKLARGATVKHAYATPGKKTVTVTATDALGNTGRAATRVVTVTAGPSVGRLSVSPKRFAVAALARSAVHRSRRRIPRGATIHFTLSQDAKVTLTVVGTPVRHCRRVHGHRRCTTSKAPRHRLTSRHLKRGAHRLAFSGRLKGKALKAGRYTIEAFATDAAGVRGKTAQAGFELVGG
ncbi:MAG TPA: PKD domain-containing protein [Conexibacter sp.]|nr:PKD domain-containing protein [Conexibacter sp.]